MSRLDPLAGLTGAQRLRKERDDGEYVTTHPEFQGYADRDALERFGNTYAGTILGAKNFKPYRPGKTRRIDAVICARCDLEHPLYFPDNQFANCTECGCDLQHRPFIPSRPSKYCISCIARRLREGKSFRRK